MENKIKRVAYAPNAAVTGDFFNKYCIGGWNEIDVSDTDGDLRPVALPKVGWLPIGDKKEFEEGTLFTCFKHGVGEVLDNSRDTHYLPPLPVLDGVKTIDEVCEQPKGSFNESIEFEDLNNQVEELNRRLRITGDRFSELKEKFSKVKMENTYLTNCVKAAEAIISKQCNDEEVGFKRKREPSNHNSPMKQDENLSEKDTSFSDKDAIGANGNTSLFVSPEQATHEMWKIYSDNQKRKYKAHIAELEEKLRNAKNEIEVYKYADSEWQERFKTERESRIRVEEQLLEVTMQRDELARNTPKWQELEKFEGQQLPYNMVLSGHGCFAHMSSSLLGEGRYYPAKEDAIDRGYTPFNLASSAFRLLIMPCKSYLI